ncbi:SH3 domain-containing protein [Candidatus Fermentibacteria bacterium]|nr:SH3 domain-containing protein [Candidatus Fermentibacteria bacterium]
MRYRRVMGCAMMCAVAACGHGSGNLDGMLAEGRLDDVLRESAKCLESAPERLDCLVARARALDTLGRVGEAAAAWHSVVNVEATHTEAWERLIAYVEDLPAPSFALELIGTAAPPGHAVGADRHQLWSLQVQRAESIMAVGQAMLHGAEWGSGLKALRDAAALDAGGSQFREALCLALFGAARRGETAAERLAPLREIITLCSDMRLLPSVQDRLREHGERGREFLAREEEALAAARTYSPWPGARFDATVDTCSFYPRIEFRCDETKSADIAMDFPAQSPQHTVVGERVSLLQYPSPAAPSVGMLKGSPSVIVIEEQGDYRLVSVAGLKGWVQSGSIAQKHRFTAEIRPRGSMELRVRPAKANVRVDVAGLNVFRGEVDLKPYVVYRWSF